jgi:hypothetical protein
MRPLFGRSKIWAWILNQRLNETVPISGEELTALGRVAGHLFEVCIEIDQLFDEMFEAAAGSADREQRNAGRIGTKLP